MADLKCSVSRTQLRLSGKIEDVEQLSKKFEQLRGDKRITMTINYDEHSKMSTILLSPCTVIEEYATKKGSEVCCRIIFCVDASTLPGLTKDGFNDKVWMKYKKNFTYDNIVSLVHTRIPDVKDDGKSIFFELLGCGAYTDRKKSHDADADFRNNKMMAAKMFMLRWLAEQIETKSSVSPAAKELDEISMALAEELFGSATTEEVI